MDPAETERPDHVFSERVYYFDVLVTELEWGGQDEVEILESIAETEAWLQDRPWLCHTDSYLEETRERLRKWRSTAAPSENPFLGTRLAFGGPRSLQWSSVGYGSGVKRKSTPLQPTLLHHPVPPSGTLHLRGRGALRGLRKPQEGPSGGVRTMEGGRPQREPLATEAGSQEPAPSSGGGCSHSCSMLEVPTWRPCAPDVRGPRSGVTSDPGSTSEVPSWRPCAPDIRGPRSGVTSDPGSTSEVPSWLPCAPDIWGPRSGVTSDPGSTSEAPSWRPCALDIRGPRSGVTSDLGGPCACSSCSCGSCSWSPCSCGSCFLSPGSSPEPSPRIGAWTATEPSPRVRVLHSWAATEPPARDPGHVAGFPPPVPPSHSRFRLGPSGIRSLRGGYCDVQSLLCLFISISLASILPFCVSLCLCVWQGAWLLLSRSRSDTPAPNSCQSPSPYKPGRRTTSRPDYCVFMLSSCATLLGFSSSSRPGSTSQPAPCRSARHLPLLPFRPASTSPGHPAVPSGIYPSCSSCRSARHLPLLLTLPFQPVPTSPAHPAVPTGTYLSCFNKLC